MIVVIDGLVLEDSWKMGMECVSEVCVVRIRKECRKIVVVEIGGSPHANFYR